MKKPLWHLKNSEGTGYQFIKLASAKGDYGLVINYEENSTFMYFINSQIKHNIHDKQSKFNDKNNNVFIISLLLDLM